LNLEKFRDLHIMRLVFCSWCERVPQTFQEALSCVAIHQTATKIWKWMSVSTYIEPLWNCHWFVWQTWISFSNI